MVRPELLSRFSGKRRAQAKLITMVRGKGLRLNASWTILDHTANPSKSRNSFEMLAGTTRLATSAVTAK